MKHRLKIDHNKTALNNRFKYLSNNRLYQRDAIYVIMNGIDINYHVIKVE